MCPYPIYNMYKIGYIKIKILIKAFASSHSSGNYREKWAERESNSDVDNNCDMNLTLTECVVNYPATT